MMRLRATMRHRVGEVDARARASDSPDTSTPENAETNGKTTRSRVVDLADTVAQAETKTKVLASRSFGKALPVAL